MSTTRSGVMNIGDALHQLGFVKKSEGPKQKTYNYPFMDAEAIRITIQNAKERAEAYNKEQEERNEGFREMNREYRRNILKEKHTTQQRILWDEFKREHKMSDMHPLQYNTLAIRFNRDNGTNFLMRTYRTLRNEIAVSLAHLVIFYSAQIKEHNLRRMQAGVSTIGTLPKLRTNSENLKRFKIEGVRQNPFENETILAHIHNLVEAGILIDYKSHGRYGGFSVRFNPEILCVKDANSSKSQNADKQSLTSLKRDKHPYSDTITRTLLNNNQIKADEPQKRNEQSSKVVTGTHKNSYRVTPSVSTQDENTKNLRQKSSEKSADPVVSQKLSAKIQDTWDLCLELEGGKHENHLHLPIKALREEANHGILTQQEFRELLFQDFMKYISKLKRGDQSFAGAYYKAFETLVNKKMVNFAGRFYQKSTMVDEFEKWLWMVDHAERWGKKRDWNFLYINDYLDINRRDAKEMGFWYLLKIWNDNERRKAAYAKEQSKKRAEAMARKEKIKHERREKFGMRSIKPTKHATDYEKARRIVRKYLYKQVTFDEMYLYCQNNLNQSIVQGLKKIIENETASLNTYKA